jgi:hypothetical protein
MVALLSRREQDGLSLRRLAEESGIPIGTLAWWSWRLRQRDAKADDEGGGEFVEVVAAEPQECSGIAVMIGSDLRVEVTAGFDVELLRSVVRALQSC